MKAFDRSRRRRQRSRPLAGLTDEYVPLEQVVEIATNAGFAAVEACEASQDEWDECESGYCARYSRWLDTHEADHPDAGEVRERAARQRSGYCDGYRGVLGFAYLVLVAV